MTRSAAGRTRVATSTDIADVVRVTNAAYRVEDFFVHGDRTGPADIANRMTAPGSVILVADEPGIGVIGSVHVTVHGKRGHFGLLSVDPDRQGRGLGRQLVRAAEEHCRAAGCTELRLDHVDLRDELPAFYEQLGFVRTGVTTPMPDTERLKRPAHLVEMRKTL